MSFSLDDSEREKQKQTKAFWLYTALLSAASLGLGIWVCVKFLWPVLMSAMLGHGIAYGGAVFLALLACSAVINGMFKLGMFLGGLIGIGRAVHAIQEPTRTDSAYSERRLSTDVGTQEAPRFRVHPGPSSQVSLSAQAEHHEEGQSQTPP